MTKPKPVTYEDTRAISLTVGDMLTLVNALYDAERYNEQHNYPVTAKCISKLFRNIQDQAEHWLVEADANLLANITKHDHKEDAA